MSKSEKRHAHADLRKVALGGIEIVMPSERTAKWDLAISEVNQTGIHAARAGFVLNILKHESGHGSFTKELAKSGIGERDARNCMRIASALMSLSGEQQKKLTSLGKTSLLALVKLPKETLEDIADGEELDDIAIMSTRQLQEHARQLQHKLEKTEMKVEKAAKKAGEKITGSGFQYPPSIDRVRVESTALANQSILCLDDMEQLLTELLNAPDLSDDRNKQESEYSAGASTLFINLQAVVAKATYLMNGLTEAIGEDYMPSNPDEMPVLTDEEVIRVNTLREMMTQEHRAKQIARENKPRKKRSKKKASK